MSDFSSDYMQRFPSMYTLMIMGEWHFTSPYVCMCVYKTCGFHMTLYLYVPIFVQVCNETYLSIKTTRRTDSNVLFGGVVLHSLL